MKSLKLGSFIATAMLLLSVVATMAQPQDGGQGRQQRTPEQMAKASVEKMAETLGLDDEQQKAIYEINLEAFKAHTQQQGEERPSREKMMEERKKLSEKIKVVLNEEQTAKFEKMEAEMAKGGSQGQGQGRR